MKRTNKKVDFSFDHNLYETESQFQSVYSGGIITILHNGVKRKMKNFAVNVSKLSSTKISTE